MVGKKKLNYKNLKKKKKENLTRNTGCIDTRGPKCWETQKIKGLQNTSIMMLQF